MEGQLAEEVTFGRNSTSNLPPLGESSIPAIENAARRSSTSSVRNRDHRAAKPTLSLRSKCGSFKFALTQRQSASPGHREIVPLTTLSSKDEDSTPIELSNSDSDETVEQ